ncbi:MAG TPA: CHAT domain-containing protein [Actinophytocola sp.]|uniref:CHAT domain-containing protein n=1 Tax=Actinophytocola sp. TaxID=1872138 RepID=UPI002DDC9E96|nr:CHAT domain-containing protein [Actinophytocola sp.]HEV2778938.1 CHAT domain-containing protein [Actinophytocola sp.]
MHDKPLPRQIDSVSEDDIDAAQRLLMTLFEDPDPDAAAAAVEAWQRIVDATPDDDPDRADQLARLSQAARVNAGFTGPPDGLEVAVASAMAAVEATPDGDPRLAYYRANAAALRWIRFERTGTREDLDAAIDTLAQAIAELPADAPVRGSFLDELATYHYTRLELAGDPADEEAVFDRLREALDTMPEGDPDRVGTLSKLGSASRSRFERTGEPADLDTAVKLSEQVVELVGEDDPDWTTARYNLGAAQHIRYEHGRVPEDLDAALANLRRAAEATPVGHPGHAMAWSSLGIALRSQFERTGDLADLDAAIAAGQRAVDAVPADDPERPAFEANLEGTLTVRLRHAGVGDVGAGFSVWTAAAIRVAGEDPERGLALFDELLDRAADIDAPADSTASLGYNRAAALRALERTEEAAAAYRRVVERFASHPDPHVIFWVGLALYNHITLLLNAPGRAAAEQVPALVDKFQEQVADHEHPGLARRLRMAMRMEAELFEELQRTEQAQRAKARLDDLLRPAVQHVLARLEESDPIKPVDEAAPRWPMDRRPLVECLLYELDECLDAVRELADASTDDMIKLIRAPLFSVAAIEMITAARDGLIPGAESDDDRDRIGRGLDVLNALLQFLFENPGAFPWGAGLIETLFTSVDASVSMADALEHARSASVVATLSLPYVHALVEATAMNLIGEGKWRQGSRLQQLVLAAAERLPNSEEGRAIVAIARYRWLFVARQLLINLPDGRVLHSARDAGERLLRSIEATPDEEPGQRAEVLLALGALYIAPHNNLYNGGSSDTINLSGYRRWLDRRSEYVLDPVEVPGGVGVAMPDIIEMIDTGEAYLLRALELAEPVQLSHVLNLILNVYSIRSALGLKIDEEALADIAARAVASTDAEAYPQLLTNALLSQWSAGQRPDPAAIERLLSRSIAEIAEQVGAEAATGTLVGVGQLLRYLDRPRARRLFADAEDYIRGLGERDRLKVLQVHQLLWLDASDLADGEPGPGADPEEASIALLEQAAEADWPRERTALALLALTGRGWLGAENAAGEEGWLTNLEVIPEYFEDVFAGHTDALSALTAAWYTQVSTRAYERGELEHAMRTQAAACAEFLALSAPDAAMECLTLIAKYVADAGGKGLATAAAETLGPLAVTAENLIGAAATEVLQTIWSQVIGAVTDGSEAPALFACLQMAKGARFVDALRAGVEFDARADEQSAHLLELLGQLDEEPDRDVDLDAFTLVTPYSERLDAAGMSLAQQRINLERTFDAGVQRRLTGDESFRLLSIDSLLGLLPVDTVLLYIYLSHNPEGGRSLLSLVATSDRLVLVPNPIADAEHANQRTEVHVGDRVRVLDGLGLSADWMRRAVLTEPGPVRPIARSTEAALIDGLPQLFGPVTDLLRQEYAAGRRHLAIVPHAGLHFAPLHLLYLDGRPLAETWAVTYLPNLALLERDVVTRAGKGTLASVGVGFADGRLPPIPEAVEEAQAVAAEFGTTALIDEQATEVAVFDALSSARLFHIATHGVHNVAAPAFQSLYVADERVSAHELLRLDLSGLDLVTLSACETALGRFDAADNLRGIPASLLLRGASAIVGTLWPVETRTSRDFFTTLYRELRRGRSRLDSFTEAQRQTRAAHPQYRDWGAFYYTGDWR